MCRGFRMHAHAQTRSRLDPARSGAKLSLLRIASLSTGGVIQSSH